MSYPSPSAEELLPLRKAISQYQKLVGYCMAMTIVILLWGYDSVIVNNITAIPKFQEDYGQPLASTTENETNWMIPSLWLGLWSSISNLGNAIGAIAGGWMQDRIGRRQCLLIGSIITAGSIFLMFFSNRSADVDSRRSLLLIGKVIQGIALGIIKIQTMTYISENVPTCLRGAIMALFPVFTLLGQLIGALVIFSVEEYESEKGYLIAMGSQWAFSIAPFILAFIMPESPPYLVRRRDYPAARRSLERLFAPKNNVDSALARIRESIEYEEKTAANVSYAECFNPSNRRRTFVIIFANLLPPFFGLPLLSSISYFLQQVGMESRNSITCFMIGIALGLVANVASTWTLSHVGRRKLTITTMAIASLLWGGMGISGFWQNANITPWTTAALGISVIVVCGVGCWPASYAIMSEASALRLRAKSQAIGGISAYVSAIVTYFVLPYFYNPDALQLGAKTGFLFAGLCVIGAVTTYFLVPEMKGKTVLEIDQLFERKVKARGSSE
ncbi:MFS general substrate transporter [Corynespora cassiicola Philippines]|uniref:MFS general substrate transporter n=1 Tax=Corynespora cassiicola Philippines TaxID=1448308 RepID=A0A2T2NA51_CORCC|nr:MFS general substrate transporter [Corynespora cassiicola Philippines]